MISLTVIPLAVLLVMASPAGSGKEGGRLSVTLEEVDALELRFGLDELLEHLDAQLGKVDRPEARRRTWELVRAFYGFHATRQEIGLLRKKLKTIEALCALDSMLVANAQAPDEQWLQTDNKVITQKIAVLNKTEQCRLYLLEVLEAANAEIKSHANPNRRGK